MSTDTLLTIFVFLWQGSYGPNTSMIKAGACMHIQRPNYLGMQAKLVPNILGIHG
jgi:hypothetical protein